MSRVSGKSVIITGANRGIGLGLANGFLAAGADVSILGAEGDVPEVAAALSDEHGRPVVGVQCDIADAKQVEGFALGVERVDVLINNAGLEYRTPVNDPSTEVDEYFRRIIEINVIGTFAVTRALLPKISDGGRIINTSSIWGKTGVAEYSAYCASKHAIIGLTRSLAQELGSRNISVNAVCPGWVRTDASMRSLRHMADAENRPEAELLDEFVGAQALDGLMEPQDMVDMYLFLASNAARNITGQAFTVDRGELMQ